MGTWIRKCIGSLEQSDIFILIQIFFTHPRPDGVGTITVEEKSKFEEVKDRLWNLLANQIVHFRCVKTTVIWLFKELWATIFG